MNYKKLTLNEAISRYIDSRTAVLSPSTIYGYRKSQRQYLQELMDTELRELNQENIQYAINRMSSRYSPKTVRNAYGLIHATLQMFCPDLRLHIALPQKIKTDFYVPDESEIVKIAALIKGNVLEIPFLLAATCGLRPSEICGLTKACVYKGQIEIKKAIVVNENGKEVVKPPKTFSGYRNIPIPSELEAKLLAVEGSRVCTLTSNQISRYWQDFLRDNGFRHFRFYALRHYFASQALLLNIPQKYIAELMGHSSTMMIERVYQHTFPSAFAEFKQQIKLNAKSLM